MRAAACNLLRPATDWLRHDWCCSGTPLTTTAPRRHVLGLSYVRSYARASITCVTLTWPLEPPLPTQFPSLSAVAGILLHTAVVWVVAYTVAPSLIHMEQQRAPGLDDLTVSTTVSGSPTTSFPQCDNPRMSQLLSCRPVWQQCCLAACLVAFPIALASVSHRWLWGRYHRTLSRRHGAAHVSSAQTDHRRRQQEEQEQQSDQRVTYREQPPAEPWPQPGVAELAPAGATDNPAALPNSLYDSRILSRTVTVKVRQGRRGAMRGIDVTQHMLVRQDRARNRACVVLGVLE